MIKIFGFICEKRSTNPGTPKSGEQELQIAPNALAPKKHSTVSI